jgi:hypothetical protein
MATEDQIRNYAYLLWGDRFLLVRGTSCQAWENFAPASAGAKIFVYFSGWPVPGFVVLGALPSSTLPSLRKSRRSCALRWLSGDLPCSFISSLMNPAPCFDLALNAHISLLGIATTQYALERLLYRLSISAYKDKFVLKGAVSAALARRSASTDPRSRSARFW